MKRYIKTYNEAVGFHCYPDAPEFCSYLANSHRHVFVIRGTFEVSHNERQIEINEQAMHIDQYLAAKYGTPCNFGAMSCETIAQELLEHFNAYSFQVLEDNYAGAEITRQC